MRFFLFGGMLLFLSACSGTPFTKSLSLHPQSQEQERDQGPDQELFVAALDQFSANNKLELMDDLVLRYPDSVWATYAETISLYARELDTRKDQLTTAQSENQQQLVEIEALKQENRQLTETIDKLKSLLIELEQRPH